MERIAVIGLGNISARHRRNLRQLHPKADILAMAASGRPVTEPVADASLVLPSLEAVMAAAPDYAVIASPAPFHAQQAEPLLGAGIPCLIEKPLVAEAAQLAQLPQASKAFAAVGYCLRFLPAAGQLNALLQTNALGQLLHVSVNVGQHLAQWRPHIDYRQSVSANRHLGGGVLLELSHELDYLQWLLGPLALRHALLRGGNLLGVEVECGADLCLTTQGGAVCQVHMDLLQSQPQRHCQIVGELGRLDWDLLANRLTLTTAQGQETLYSAPEWDKNGMYLAMLQSFEAQLNRPGPSPLCTLAEAAQTVHLIDLIKTEADWIP